MGRKPSETLRNVRAELRQAHDEIARLTVKLEDTERANSFNNLSVSVAVDTINAHETTIGELEAIIQSQREQIALLNAEANAQAQSLRDLQSENDQFRAIGLEILDKKPVQQARRVWPALPMVEATFVDGKLNVGDKVFVVSESRETSKGFELKVGEKILIYTNAEGVTHFSPSLLTKLQPA